jgi:hypothetical protein
MNQEAYNRLNSDSQSKKPIGFRRGCLMLLIPLIVIYFTQAIFLFAPNTINQVKWRIRGSANYEFTVSKIGLLPPDIQIGRNVVVKDGRIASVSNVSLREPVYSSDIETIQEMLNGVYICALLFPLITCSYKYDSFRGYPIDIKVDCPIPDACYSYTSITKFEILSP